MFISKNLDYHSWIHFFGCYSLTGTLIHRGVPLWLAPIITGILAYTWEWLDEQNHNKKWNISFLDPRGGDVMDLIVSLGGILLAFIVFGY